MLFLDALPSLHALLTVYPCAASPRLQGCWVVMQTHGPFSEDPLLAGRSTSWTPCCSACPLPRSAAPSGMLLARRCSMACTRSRTARAAAAASAMPRTSTRPSRQLKSQAARRSKPTTSNQRPGKLSIMLGDGAQKPPLLTAGLFCYIEKLFTSQFRRVCLDDIGLSLHLLCGLCQVSITAGNKGQCRRSKAYGQVQPEAPGASASRATG